MDRFEILKGGSHSEPKKQDAYERALELCNISIEQVPELARTYSNYLINDRRLAIEPRLFLMSYAHYAQAVEGLPTTDEKLKISRLPKHGLTCTIKRQEEGIMKG